MKNQSIQTFFDALRPCQESQELARFSHFHPQDRVLDVGCGIGYLSFYVKWKFPNCSEILGIDINPSIIEAANRNLNLLQDQMNAPLSNLLFRTIDARSDMSEFKPFDALISNPPFFAANSSRRSPSENRRIARQDGELTLKELFKCAQRSLRSRGRMFFVIPAMREQEAGNEAVRNGFQIERIAANPAIRKRSGGIRLIAAVKQELS